ncbi:hypothetical protein GPECTOR_27g631 [Gonium pectorale]|uniref:Ankyrin repeat domain-containing protein n=1 Tax=Gonium pectorale TaxID=33097 RepID=A0A150GF26_GONPE|nr:hypothetical protein GPECTOR_27g631 [Gonium pectorale]|eukprot:KXZ48461.1 hypothetical protein GPECTOR_27g631 [Gonium pectorale]
MNPNEVALNLRAISKAAAAALSWPKNTTIRLSKPVPPHAFSEHWLSPGATRGLTRARREELLRLTAASGSTTNLAVALQATGCPLSYEVFEAAASAGKLAACEWLLERGSPWRWDAAGGVSEVEKVWALVGAAGNPTPDWAAKVEWLEAQGCRRGSGGGGGRGNIRPEVHAERAVQCDNAAAHLAWLRRRGYPMARGATMAAFRRGDVAAIQLLTEDAVQLARELPSIADGAARHEAIGWALDPRASAKTAARDGHLAVLSWLLETFGDEAVGLDAELFHCAAESGSVELMAWLRERGCPWDAFTYCSAADSGCEAALEWLVERGCPMPVGCSASWASR